jgi:uncharacterized lipoprotein YddW (UPF0748 family)
MNGCRDTLRFALPVWLGLMLLVIPAMASNPMAPLTLPTPPVPSGTATPLVTEPPQTLAPITTQLVQTQTYRVAVIDPTLTTNPAGSGFPGFRGGQQLVLYTPRYGSPNTGTNEFGFEVTVVNGRVVRQEGANSDIPLTGDPATTFVISGHGKARDWLIAHAPIGATVQLMPDGNAMRLLVSVSPETALFQLQQRLQAVQNRVPAKVSQQAMQTWQRLTTLWTQSQHTAPVDTQATEALNTLNQHVWQAMPRFPARAIKGAWHRPVELTETAIAHRLDTLKQAGLNTVFLETFYHGYTIFPSQTYTQYGLPTPYPQFAHVGFDPLATWTRLAHDRGMQLHVWFQTFYGGTRAFQSPGPILSKYPDWANVQYVAMAQPGPTPSNVELGHYFLDPANPAVQTFLQALLVEIATRYAVDGVQLDYIRYGSSFPIHRFSYLKTTWGYTPVARADFARSHSGVDPATLTPTDTPLWTAWMQYKTQQVTRFVQRSSQAMKAARPGLQVSAAVFPGLEDATVKKHQDWATWAAQGWVDFLAPMTLTSATKVVHADIKHMRDETQRRVPIISGLFGAFNGNTPALLMDQVYEAHQAGAAGIALFDTAHLTPAQLHALQQAR